MINQAMFGYCVLCKDKEYQTLTLGRKQCHLFEPLFKFTSDSPHKILIALHYQDPFPDSEQYIVHTSDIRQQT